MSRSTIRPCRPADFGFQPVDQVDGGMEAATGAGADAGAGNGDRKMALSSAGTTNQYGWRKAPVARSGSLQTTKYRQFYCGA